MNKRGWIGVALLIVAALAPAAARASTHADHAMGVEVWTDRGSDAVYQPGDALQVKVRASDDAYLLVYEIDSEGYVRLLFPFRGSNGFVEARSTYRVPPDNANLELQVEQQTGEGYLVAIASREPLGALPAYLRPYDPQAEGVGYVGEADEEEGITADGKIVGDPFVAMERIRRRVLQDPEDVHSFATSYTTYYVHEQVRYPRYLCYDCHRPGHYEWWDGFDPYYTSCSVFDFRVNWSWCWGPSYWFGSVPYYCFCYRTDCPPRYRPSSWNRWYSSWDGWRTWCNFWPGNVRHYKAPPPVGYVPPGRYWKDPGIRRLPPGFLGAAIKPNGYPERLPIGRRGPTSVGEPGPSPRRGTGGFVRPGPGGGRYPVSRVPPGDDGSPRGSRWSQRNRDAVPQPSYRPPRDDGGRRVERPREAAPQSGGDRHHGDRAPRAEPPRGDKPKDSGSPKSPGDGHHLSSAGWRR